MATFSITEIRSFRRCRRQWDYGSVNRGNLTTKKPSSDALELGSLIHRALARWILEHKQDEHPDTLANIFLHESSSRIKEVRDSYYEVYGYYLDDNDLAPVLDSVPLGQAMMSNYQLYHKRPIPEHMSFASPEQEILVPVPNTNYQCTCNLDHECRECRGTGVACHYIRATLDGLLRDNKGRLFVLEHKTYGSRPSLEYLLMDDQFTGYAWVVSQLGMGDVAGIAYDGMWKRDKIPGIVDKRKGVLGDLFLRKPIVKSEAELEQWGINVTKTVLDMANDPYIVPNVPWQGCFDCGFKVPCMSQMLGNDVTHLLKQQYMENKIVRVQGTRNKGVEQQ